MAVHQRTCDELNHRRCPNLPSAFISLISSQTFGALREMVIFSDELRNGLLAQFPAICTMHSINKTPSILVHESSLGGIVHSINGSVHTKSIRP